MPLETVAVTLPSASSVLSFCVETVRGGGGSGPAAMLTVFSPWSLALRKSLLVSSATASVTVRAADGAELALTVNTALPPSVTALPPCTVISGTVGVVVSSRHSSASMTGSHCAVDQPFCVRRS